MTNNIVVIEGELSLTNTICGEIESVFYVDKAHPLYPGPYVVDPTFTDVILDTSGKLMGDDVTVKEIYVGRVTNPSGGKTITIGV